ncbi:MAG TPA: Xaa-Pro peptidase family protein [Clostridia bacterium]|nr:Xaa-Pro peptidase family protein [Clostridia bacterium]
MIDYKERIKDLRNHMSGTGIDACFLTKSSEQEYLTGIPKGRYNPTYANTYGDWAYGVYVFPDKVLYLVPQMLLNLGHVEENTYGIIDEYITIVEGVPVKDTVQKALGDRLKRTKRIAVTKNTFSTTLISFMEMLPDLQLVSLEDYMNGLRMIKTDYELSKMKEAAEVNDRVFAKVVPLLKVGMSEIDIKTEIEHQILLEGCEGTSFHTGVMIYGGKGKPHRGGATGKIIEAGTTIAFDFGVMKDGFCSDFGRTVYAGEPTEEMVKIHEIIVEAQRLAMAAMVPGEITCEDLNMVARRYIEERGYGKGFRHRLGHSIGRDVHEHPYLMPGYREVLQKNMTFTIEPSIIIDDKMLIRVEDVVAVGDSGGVPLSNFSKDIIVI